jgi:hypothetical protein
VIGPDVRCTARAALAVRLADGPRYGSPRARRACDTNNDDDRARISPIHLLDAEAPRSALAILGV